MAQLTTRRQYAANEPLLASDIEAFIDDIEVFVNVININDDNLQDAGITASTKIADGTLTAAELNNLAITTAKIADSNITTVKLADGSVTTAKIVDANVTTAKILDGTVAAANIAALAITGPKLEAALKTTGSINIASATIASNTSTYSVVGSVGTITTYGGPLLMQGTTGFFVVDPGTGLAAIVKINLYIERAPSGGAYTRIFQTTYERHMAGNPTSSSTTSKIPISILKHIDTPAAGTWDYRLFARFYLESELTAGFVFTHTQPLSTSSDATILLKELI